MSSAQVRQISIQFVLSLGFPKPPEALPLSEAIGYEKSISSIIERCACLTAVVACCFGFEGQRALMWLKKNNADQSLTEDEQRFLGFGADSDADLKERLKGKLEIRIEALWSLCWALDLINQLDWEQYCGENLVNLIPDLEAEESLQFFEKKVSLRDVKEIIQQEDIAYCLDWAIVEARAKNLRIPGKLRAYAIRERRHALSWLLSKEKWDDVSLDT